MEPFGKSKNHGLYLPMSEDESETLIRLWEGKEYRLFDKTLGELEILNVIVGDKRLGIQFRIGPKCFEGYEIFQPFPVFQLELFARGRLLSSKEMTTMYDGSFLMVGRGFFADLQLDLAIEKINPELIKEVKNTIGLTSRRGNEKFTTLERFLVDEISKGNTLVKKIQEENLSKAKKSKKLS